MAVLSRTNGLQIYFYKKSVCIKPIQNARILTMYAQRNAFESVFALPLGVIYYFEIDSNRFMKNKLSL